MGPLKALGRIEWLIVDIASISEAKRGTLDASVWSATCPTGPKGFVHAATSSCPKGPCIYVVYT